MAEYNNSPFPKEKWEKVKAKCEKDEDLKTVWKVFEKVFNGSNKKVIDAFDNFLDFAFTTIEVATGAGLTEEDFEEEDLIEMGGDVSNMVAMRKVLAKILLKNKEDKTFERLEVIMKNLAGRVQEREEFIAKLSAEDSDEIVSKSSLVELARKHNPKAN
jgi:hypothetical protein